MDRLADDYPEAIQARRDAPCLSLYQPTHRTHPDKAQDPIRYRNLLKSLTQSLHKKYAERDVAGLLQPLHAIADDVQFWNHTLDGLAVLAAPGFFRVYKLQRPVPELVVAADSFHTKPLMRIMQSADRFQVLGLNRHEACLFEGNRDRLDPSTLPRRCRTRWKIRWNESSDATATSARSARSAKAGWGGKARAT